MTLYLSNRDGVGGTSLTNEEGHYRFQTQSWTGDIVMGSGNELAVTQNSPLGMSVLIGTGDFKIDTTGYSYTGWNSASLVATVSTANPSNPRKDAVVLYVDKSENTPGTANNPGIIKQMVVAGTPAGSPVAPDDTAISTAVGAGNPYIRLANVTVGTGVTQITNANIASTRVLAAPKLPAKSVTSTALDFSTGIWWEELGRSVATTATTSLSVTIPQRAYIKVLAKVENNYAGANSAHLRFNGESGETAYARRHIELPASGTIAGLTTDTSNIVIAVFDAVNNKSFITYEGDGGPKNGQWLSGHAVASGDRNTRMGYSSTKGSTPVTSVSIQSSQTNGLKPGCELIVLGHN